MKREISRGRRSAVLRVAAPARSRCLRGAAGCSVAGGGPITRLRALHRGFEPPRPRSGSRWDKTGSRRPVPAPQGSPAKACADKSTRARAAPWPAGEEERRWFWARVRASGGGGREDFATGFDESPFHLAILKPIERAARDQQQIVTWRHEFLVGSKHFAQAAFGSGALRGVAHRRTRGDDSKARRRGFAGDRGRRFNRFTGNLALARVRRRARGWRWRALSAVPQHKGAAIRAAPVGADMLEIQLTPKVLFGAETHVGLRNAAAQRDRWRLRRRSSACGLWRDERLGPCGHQQWLYGRGSRFCGRV